MQKPANDSAEKIRQLEATCSGLKIELEEIRNQLEEEKEKRHFYQLIADFTFGWELWFAPGGEIKYCSPSSFDITGFTPNQIVGSGGIAGLLVYEPDKSNFESFLQKSLDQLIVNQTLEFRILTRTRQLRWCMMNVRGVYDKLGKYLGIRASIHDISRLKKAMSQIQEMEVSKEFENRNKERLQSQLQSRERDIVSFLLQLSQKNELLSKALNQLKALTGKQQGLTRENIKQLVETLENREELHLDWAMIEDQVEKINPGFLQRLHAKHPLISAKERKLCVYLQLGLTSKEISGLLNITPKSVEIARVRLRKKLKIPPKIRLSNYLNQL